MYLEALTDLNWGNRPFLSPKLSVSHIPGPLVGEIIPRSFSQLHITSFSEEQFYHTPPKFPGSMVQSFPLVIKFC